MDYRNASLIDMLDHHATSTPERPFLQWMDGQPETFGQVHLATRRLAAGLSSIGVNHSDTVLIMLPNGPEIVHTWFACNALGALEVPVNTHLRGDFLTHIIRDSLASIIVIHSEYLKFLEDVKLPSTFTTLVVVGPTPSSAPHGLKVVPYADLAGHQPIDSLRPAGLGDLSGIFYTSGTTGPAKGIMFTFGQGCVTARNYLDATGANADDIFFCCMPLFHSNAQVLQILAPLMIGGQVSIWPQFSAKQWLDQVRSVGATISNTLGVMAEFLYRQPPRDDDNDNPLRIVQTIPAPQAIVADFERRFGVTCIDGYGLTDVGMVAFRKFDQTLVPGSSGKVVDDYEVIIADPDSDEPLPPGSVGEILIRPRVAGGFMKGYWQRPDLSVEAWRNLWFHTGDSGRIDGDGQLFFSDRLGDSIRIRGENVSSAEIEAVLIQHPVVHQCAAIAVPSDVGDYDVLLAVVTQPGISLDPEDLLRFCAGRMPYFAIPRYVEQFEELPMTSTQKIRKVALRDRGINPSTWDRVAAGFVVTR